MFQQRKSLVQTRVLEIIKKANELYGITLPTVQVRFDLTGVAAGVAGTIRGMYYVRFNVQMMENSAWDHLYNDTIAHELAHIVCFAHPNMGSNHDYGWKRVCMQLGGNGERCHSQEVVHKGGTFYYTTASGRVIALSAVRHSRVQRMSVTYTSKHGDVINSKCSFSTTAQPTAIVKPAALPKIPVVQPTTIPASGSKADMVRSRIVIAKLLLQGESVPIEWAVLNLGMSKALATSYVRNNWEKA